MFPLLQVLLLHKNLSCLVFGIIAKVRKKTTEPNIDKAFNTDEKEEESSPRKEMLKMH